MSIVKRNNTVFPSLVNEFFRPDWFGGSAHQASSFPAVNIKETDEGFLLELALPGFAKEDFKIELDNELLSISSEVTNENTADEEHYTRMEFSFESFKRTFTLPETVDQTKINANYENGILSLDIPKKEEALPKPKRMITIG